MQSLRQDEVGVFSVVFLPYLLSISISMSRHKNLPRPNKNDHSASYLSRYLSSTFISFVLFRLFISLLNYSILLLLRTCRHNNSFQSQKDNMLGKRYRRRLLWLERKPKGKLHVREGLVRSEKFCKQHHGTVFVRNQGKA